MPSDSALRRILYPLTAAAILAWFLFFTGKSLWFYFDQDDMMNLYLAWSKPAGEILKANVFFWSGFFRPLGALFYRALFAVAGFNPVPFRMVCLAMGIFNLWLCFWLTRLVAGSDRVAALTTLLFAFHSRLMEVWFRTGVVYDLLSFTFFWLAAGLYISARRRGRFPGPGRTMAIVVSYICALGAKEVAVTLPVVLLAYELIFARVKLKRLWLIGLLGLLSVPYIIGKTHGADALTNNPAYLPEYSLTRFTHSWSVFLNYIFLREDGIKPWMGMGILAVMLAIALAFRSRRLLFTWIVLFAATLPVVFLPYRGGFVLYVSWVGWAMYAALILIGLQNVVTRSRPGFRTALACLVFLLVGWRWGKANLHDQRIDPRHWLYDPAAMVRNMADEMRSLHPVLPRGASVLLLKDPFTTGEWTPYFIMKLLYKDDTMAVARIKMMDVKPADWNAYQYVFTFEDGRYRQLKP